MVPKREGQISYLVRADRKVVALVALRRADSDELAWFECASKPYKDGDEVMA